MIFSFRMDWSTIIFLLFLTNTSNGVENETTTTTTTNKTFDAAASLVPLSGSLELHIINLNNETMYSYSQDTNDSFTNDTTIEYLVNSAKRTVIIEDVEITTIMDDEETTTTTTTTTTIGNDVVTTSQTDFNITKMLMDEEFLNDDESEDTNNGTHPTSMNVNNVTSECVCETIESRFLFPEESDLLHEQVLVDESGIPTACSSIVDLLKTTFLHRVNELVSKWNTQTKLVKLNETCDNDTSIIMDNFINVTVGFNETEPIRLSCGQRRNFGLQNSDYRIVLTILEDPILLLVNYYNSNASVTSHDEYKLITDRYETDAIEGTHFQIVCLCSSTTNQCGIELTIQTTILKPISFVLSDAPSHILMTPTITPLVPNRCHELCYLHGNCDEERGICECHRGWNGKFCSFLGCENNCGHGNCVRNNNEWNCVCDNGWEGSECQFRLETDCSDRYDNDGDGLIDCQDPECCLYPICNQDQHCQTVDGPEVRFRNASSSSSSSSFFVAKTFAERIAVLTNPAYNKYAEPDEFPPETVSVIRGRVITKKGSRLPSVRITRDHFPDHGFTLSRLNGTFDFVTTGGLVFLKFGKPPFKYKSETFFLPDNEIWNIGDVIMDVNEQDIETEICHEHNYSTHSIERRSDRDVSSVYEEEPIEGSPTLTLVHVPSSESPSVLSLRLINGDPSSHLIRVSLEISLEGRLFTFRLEPESNLNFTFRWDKRDVYGFRVYGKSVYAFIKAGYRYSSCESDVWTSKTIRIHGIDPPHHDINNMRLNVAHKLDPVSHVLYKGTGETVDLTETDLLAKVRDFFATEEQSGPTAIEILDHSVYIGFSNVIMEYNMQTEKSKVLLKLNETSADERYYLAVDHKDRKIYVSLPSEKKVIQLTEINHYVTIAGNGAKCRSIAHCGDGGLAVEASLIYPKGIAVSIDGSLYLADGRFLRRIRNGIITSLTDTSPNRLHEWSPPPRCDNSWQSPLMNLRWPTKLAFNPQNPDSLIIIDDGEVFEYITDSRIIRPLYSAWCSGISRRSLDYLEKDVISVKFDQRGYLYLMANRMNGYREERLDLYKVDDRNKLTSVFYTSTDHIPEFHFRLISDFVVLRNGDVLLCDLEDGIIKRFSKRLIPNFDMTYDVPDPYRNELYHFQSNGRHMETRALFSNNVLLSFSYDASGYLNRVFNSYQSVFNIYRDYDDVLENLKDRSVVKRIDIDGTFVHRFKVMSDLKIDSIHFPSGHLVNYSYENDTLISKLEDQKLRTLFEYDEYGFLLRIINPDGTTTTTTTTTKIRRSSRPSVYSKRAVFKTQSLPNVSQNDSSGRRLLRLPYEYDSRYRWNHYGRLYLNSLNGIGKHFYVDNRPSFTVEMHPRSGIQSIYDGTISSKRYLRVEEFYVPPQRLWIPDENTGLAVIDETFTRQWLLSTIKRGNLISSSYNYDDNGRMTLRNVTGSVIRYRYEKEDTLRFPSNVTISNDDNTVYNINVDSSGDLESVITPMGHIFTFHLVPLIGSYLMSFHPPWTSEPFIRRLVRKESTDIESTDIESDSNHFESSYRFDSISGNLIEDSVFRYDSSFTSKVIRKKVDSKFYIIYESDSVNREVGKLWINNNNNNNNEGKRNEVYKEIVTYHDNSYFVASRSVFIGSNWTTILQYRYDSQGLLTDVKTNKYSWTYKRDRHGNIRNIDFESGNIEFEIEYGERILRIGKSDYVRYHNVTGVMISRHDYTFEYDVYGRIASVFKTGKLISTFFYDRDEYSANVVEQFSNGILITYEYERPDKPYLVTKVLRGDHPREETKLFYDYKDRLFYMIVNGTDHYGVITDLVGTPETIIDADSGKIIKTILRSPYGTLLREIGNDPWIPIGYRGCVEEIVSGTVIIRGRPYDAHLGQYRVPDVNKFLDPNMKLTDVTSLHGYQLRDPVFKFETKRQNLNDFDSWFTVLGLKTPKQFMTTKDDDDDDDGPSSPPTAFTDIEVQQSVHFKETNLEFAALHRGISQDPQILGPDVMVALNSQDNTVTTIVLRGAGTVERILSTLMNGTVLIESIGNDNNELHFQRRIYVVPENLELLKAVSLFPDFVIIVPDRKVSLRIDTIKFSFRFWIGFMDVEEIRAQYNQS